MPVRRDISPTSPVHTSPRGERPRGSDRGIVSPGETLFGTPSTSRTLAHSSPDLPPLPSFPLAGRLPSTPPRPSDDTEYYTASWGSPYQAPDLTSSRAGSVRGTWNLNSDDFEEESPNLQFGLAHLIPSRLPVFQVTPTRPSTPSSGVVTEQTPRSLNVAPSTFTKRPARFTALLPLRENSPFEETANPRVQPDDDEASRPPSPSDPLARYQRHRSRDSNLTLTPEDFYDFRPAENGDSDDMHRSRWANPESSPVSKSVGQPEKTRQETMVTEKSLPPLPMAEAPPMLRKDTDSPASSASAQPRQRKKLQVKGKTCYVLIPHAHGIRPPLTPGEIETRMNQFQSKGYDTRGYVEFYGNTPGEQSGHSNDRLVIPGLTDEQDGQPTKKVNIVFPDLNKWTSHMEELREAKLAALGVTIGGDEPTQESSQMSRQSSSQYRASQFSPPVPSTSAASNRMSFAGANLPAAFTPGSSNHTSTRSIASPSPSFGNPRAAMHMHRQSMFVSPSMFSPGQPGSPALGGWSPSPFNAPQLGSRGGSPALSGHRAANADRRHSVSPFSPQGELPGGFGYAGDLLAGMQQRQQQHLIQLQQQPQQQPQQQQPQQQQPQALNCMRSTPTLPDVPEAENEGETEDPGAQTPVVKSSEAEIYTPKPGHRHNISVNLERNVHSASYKLNDYLGQELAEEDAEDSTDALQTNVAGPPIPTDRSVLPIHRPSLQELRSPPSGLSPDLPDRSHSTNALPEPNGQAKFSPLVATSNVAEELKADDQKELPKVETAVKAAGPTHAHMPSHVTSVWSENDSVRDSLISPGSESQKPSRNHSKHSSISKLNVEAPEFVFNPRASFNPSIFSQSLSFQPKNTDAFRASTGSNNALKQTTKFNISAPSFAPRNGEFSFTSNGPKFKPDAPVFQPSKSFSFSVEDENRIFTNLVEIVKPPKKSKAVPIVKPASRGKSAADDDEEEHFDDLGRISQSDARFKRPKRWDDCDQVPLFAVPSSPPVLEPVHEVVEVPEPLILSDDTVPEKDEAELKESEPEREAEEVKDAGEGKVANAIVGEEQKPPQDAAILHDSGFQDGTLHSDPAKHPEEDVAGTTETMQDTTEPDLSSFAKKFSFSAAAKPFEFKSFSPNATVFVPTAPAFTPAAASFDSAADSFVPTAPLFTPTAPAFTPAIASTTVSYQPRTSLGEDHTPIESGTSHLQSPTEVHHPPPAAGRYIPGANDEYHPSFNEIDAVMRHMDEEGSDFGVERDETSYLQYTPERTSAIDVNRADLPPNLVRSDAPSPSPRRVNYQHQYQATETNSDPFSDQRNMGYGSPVRKLNDARDVPVSDWDDMVSSTEEDKLQARTTFFDNHVEELINAALVTRLEPLTEALAAIQNSMATLNTAYPRRGRRVVSSEAVDSDADDEDDEFPAEMARSRSPRKDRRFERLKNVMLEALESRAALAVQAPVESTPAVDIAEIKNVVLEALGSRAAPAVQPPLESTPPLDISELQAAISQVKETMFHLSDVKDVVENVVGEIIQRQQASDREAASAVLKGEGERYANLVNMMNEANSRVLEEREARVKAEAQESDVQRALASAQTEIARLRESADDEADRYRALDTDMQVLRSKLAATETAHDELQKTCSGLEKHVSALEATLEEYRTSSAQWRAEVDDLRDERGALRKTLDTFKYQTEEAMRIRENMRERLNTLRKDMSNAARQMADEKARWQRSDDEHSKRYEVLMARLGAEARTRERLEDELERLETQEREGMKLRVLLDQAQSTNAKLEETVAALRLESAEHQATADRYAREFREAREAGRVEVQRTRMLMEAEVDAASNQVNIVRADLESEVARVRAELDHARLEADTAKARHELQLEQEADSRRDALHAASAKMETALQEQAARYEQRIADMQQQQQRYLQNALEDKERSEAFLSEKLSLSDSKASHLEDKVSLLEERLEVAKSAAQAAIEAAKSAKSPAAAPTAAPIEKPVAPRMPEKVSAQALRETIQALQEQLQERETRIEDLDKTLSEVDREAPAKLKERETEIGWLRELLAVRVDDITDLVTALEEPTYDRETVRDAAIRIRTNLQMEQQEKERLIAGGMAFPSLATISNFATPKAAQLAAAFGNWRKGSQVRQFSVASNPSPGTDATPSRPLSSAQGFLSGLMTPPASNLRRTPSSNGTVVGPGRRGSARAAAVAPAVELHTPRQRGKARMTLPSTPPLMRHDSYDNDAQASRFPGERLLEDDASSVGEFPTLDERRSSEDQFGPAMSEAGPSPEEPVSPTFVLQRRMSQTQRTD